MIGAERGLGERERGLAQFDRLGQPAALASPLRLLMESRWAGPSLASRCGQ